LQPSHENLPPNADRVLISVNPTAGAHSSSARVDRLVALLRNARIQADVLTDLGEVARQANELHAAGRLRALVAVGGDGTVAELVNRTVAGLPIAILPAGNENLLARHLDLGAEPDACCRTIVDGALVRLDAARADRRIFLLMAGCGFDAEVVRRLHSRRRGHVQRSSYFKPIVDSIRSYGYPELRIYWNEEGGDEVRPVSWCARWLFAFNLPCYGGGLDIAPQADGCDGLLDVCTFRRGGLWHGLRYAAAIFLGRHGRLTDFAVRRVARLRIESDAEMPYQLDGDPGGVLPVEIETLAGRLTMVVPRRRISN
jgi:diacylglycerol kinase family enzyme